MTTSTADARALLSKTVKEYEYIYAGDKLVRMIYNGAMSDIEENKYKAGKGAHHKLDGR